MRRLIGLAALIFVGVLAWRIGGMLSTDAVGMAVGMVFGVLAGIPAALLVLATDRRRQEAYEDEMEVRREGAERQLPAYPYQPPIIVVTGQPQQQLAPPQPAPPPYFAGNDPAGWQTTRSQRHFRVVGDRDETLE